MTTRYELFERIGVGGMAEIFRGKAVAPGGFEKPVAIKRILPHLAQDKRFVELLIAEAKVLSLLKHRNIVQIFDVGLGDDGKYFLVMEYVDGKDIGVMQKLLETKRKRIPFDLCLHIGAEICEALEHAHSAKAPDGKPMSLVHRDVSPTNVLVSRAGEVKLTDFGIAKRAEQEATGSHAVRGKFAYISPEQARNEHVDPRSDVFSVGILLWELITNRRLFSGLGDMEALHGVREAKVPPPTEVDGRLPKEVDKILLGSLHPLLKSRPTAGQLGAQLRTLRYSLDVTVGDPATELSKILDTVEEVARESLQMPVVAPSGRTDFWHGNEHTEATVIRIATADAFAMREKDGAEISRARQVINAFEEEETRLAQLSGDQLAMLRGPANSGGNRSKRPTDEPTSAMAPLDPEDTGSGELEIPHQHFNNNNDEATRLVAHSRDRNRTPVPQRAQKPMTVPPPPVPLGPAPDLSGITGDNSTVSQRPPRRPGTRGDELVQSGTRPRDPSLHQSGERRPPTTVPPAPIQASPLQPSPLQMINAGMHGMAAQPVSTMAGSPNHQRAPGSTRPPMQQQQPPMQQQPMHPNVMSGATIGGVGPMGQLPPASQILPPHMQGMQGMQGMPGPSPYGGDYPVFGSPAHHVASQHQPRLASPTMNDAYEAPMFPQRSQPPPRVAGFSRPQQPLLQPWMLVVGAMLMAALAFAITRLFLA